MVVNIESWQQKSLVEIALWEPDVTFWDYYLQKVWDLAKKLIKAIQKAEC